MVLWIEEKPAAPVSRPVNVVFEAVYRLHRELKLARLPKEKTDNEQDRHD